MKFKSATIKDFRRFTHLTVQNIPETGRLIMLAGPNGCGKSSFFDALNRWHRFSSIGAGWSDDYYIKVSSQVGSQEIIKSISINFHDSSTDSEGFAVYDGSEIKKKNFYMRSAYRNDPEFQIRQLQSTGNMLDEIRIERMIDNDAAVSQHYQRMVGEVFRNVFEQADGSMTLHEFREQTIREIRDPVHRLFPGLELNSLADPLKDGTFRFTKGTSQGFAFKNLSGGEKAAFDLILDLVIAKRTYDNTIFCIDEPESHMNTRLQAELLSVLYDLIPGNCQLMLATHSIGMMRRARDIEAKNPGSVVFLDFGDRNFDQPQVIEPTKPDRKFWKNAYSVALDDLAALVAPSRVVICEGEPLTSHPVGNHSHDAKCYETIFETEFPETRFVSMGNDREIVGDRRGLAEALLSLIDGLEVVRLIDRDDRTKVEIEEAEQQGVRVLSKRNLESYLFDDEVLQALAASARRQDKIEELLAKKQCLVAETEGPEDDLKSLAGELRVACKRLLGLTQCGNTTMAFMRDTLAPLIKPGMSVYEDLKRDIFGPKVHSSRCCTS